MKRAFSGHRKQRTQVEVGLRAKLPQQVCAANGRFQRWQSQCGQQTLKVFGDIQEESDDVFRLATEFCPQVGTLRRNSGRAGVEMTLSSHITTQGHQHRRAKGEFVSAEQSGDQNVASIAEAAVHAQTYSAAQSVVPQHLLHLRQTQLPRAARVLDAAERRSAGAAAVSGNVNVVGVRLDHAGRNRAHAEL